MLQNLQPDCSRYFETFFHDGSITESGRSQRDHKYVASWAVATILRRFLPLRLEAVEFFSRCGRLMSLMIHWRKQKATETREVENNTNEEDGQKESSFLLLVAIYK